MFSVKKYENITFEMELSDGSVIHIRAVKKGLIQEIADLMNSDGKNQDKLNTIYDFIYQIVNDNAEGTVVARETVDGWGFDLITDFLSEYMGFISKNVKSPN